MKITPSCVSFLVALVATSSPVAAEVDSLRSIQVPEVEGEVTADAVLAETTWEVVDEPVTPTVDGVAGSPNADQLAKSANFTYVGNGRCLDSSGKEYSRFEGPWNEHDGYLNAISRALELCVPYCLQNPIPEFVGVETSITQTVKNLYSNCICLYSGGYYGQINKNSFDPPASGSYYGHMKEGRGEITSYDEFHYYLRCYKWDQYQPPMTASPSPTSSSPTTASPTSSPPCDTSGVWHMPLDMPGQRRIVASPKSCKQRCINTPGCNFFNSFPNGGCHITTGIEGTKVVSNNPTRMTGHKSCTIPTPTNAPTTGPGAMCDTSGVWHMPLNMPGQRGIIASPEKCKQWCINTPGCNFFNSFPRGGCHITTGIEGTKVVRNNPTRITGHKSCIIPTPTSAPTTGPGAMCDTSGVWHMPLNMPGQKGIIASPEKCKQRCINTPGCNFFNSFPRGGCHITTGIEGTKVVSNNPTRMTGHKSCAIPAEISQ